MNQSVLSVFQCPSTANFPRATLVDAAPDASPLGQPVELGAKDYAATNVVKQEPFFNYATGAWMRSSHDYQTPTPLALVRDGTSNTLLLAERAGVPTFYVGRPSTHPQPWPSDVPTDELLPDANYRNIQSIWPSADNFRFEHVTEALARRKFSGFDVNRRNDYGIYSFHTAGAYASFCDGHVALLAEDTDVDVVLKQFTRDSAEEKW